jgi:hypothetical protein
MRGVIAAVLAAAFLGGATPAAAADAADRAAAYIRGVQLESGFFRYEYDFLTGKWSKNDNIVRQAGAAFGLAIYHRQRPHEPTRQAVERALIALAGASISYGGGLLVSEDGSLRKAKTGATALALAAAVLAGIEGAPIDQWRDGLLALQRKDGRFQRSPVDQRPIGYYDGEAWLALALLAARDGEAAFAEALALADKGMTEGYGLPADVTFYHWGQLAAAARYGRTADPRYIDFAATQTESFLDETRPKVSDNSNSCYSLEGMAAAFALVGADPRLQALRERIGQRIRQEVAHNLSIQVQPGQGGLAVRAGTVLNTAELPEFAGAFLNGRLRLQTRIDATQHCLAALLQISKLDLPPE